jgi:hypothetical protein
VIDDVECIEPQGDGRPLLFALSIQVEVMCPAGVDSSVARSLTTVSRNACRPVVRHAVVIIVAPSSNGIRRARVEGCRDPQLEPAARCNRANQIKPMPLIEIGARPLAAEVVVVGRKTVETRPRAEAGFPPVLLKPWTGCTESFRRNT